ncbi:MAG: radical SAM protein, partial [Planctomycetes bacterium]|nr:radical SAM protein [Planctomycetota bacterium]
MPSLHDIPRAEAAFRSLGVDPGRLRRLRNAFLKKGVPWQVALLDLPQPKRVAAAAAIEPHALELAGRRDSALDGATKLLFRTRAGLLLETVILRPRTGRAALCLSSQVGCAARCVFCATGQMAAVRDLSPEEILDQVVQANQVLRLEGRKARNLVFMGMGEPFHNEEALHAALEVLL